MFQPIAATQILEVTNTSSSLFLYLPTQQYYVLLSGRWFRTRALGGLWAYVEPRTLPRDFAQIPLNHPKGAVLASVPGTPEAKQAVIANGIPHTATIARTAQLTVTYDGPPQFVPITGTALSYAKNAPLPVIQVDPAYYLALQDGVWFVASSPTGAASPAITWVWGPPCTDTRSESSLTRSVLHEALDDLGPDARGYSRGRSALQRHRDVLGAIRIDQIKFLFCEQPADWTGPTLYVNIPTILNLREDPFERFTAVNGASEYAPMQDPASFNLDAVKR